MSTTYVPPAIDWVSYFAILTPNKTATVDLAGARQQTYTELDRRAGQFACHLQSLGITKGDRVGFLALNSPDILEIIYATWRLGGVSLALNYRLTASELAYIIGDATPDIIVYDLEFTPIVEELKNLVRVKHWVATDGQGGDSEYEDAIAASSPLTQKADQSMNDPCMLMYSSGTTGHPKGVIITHGMIHYSAVNGLPVIQSSPASVFLTLMPMFHIGGLQITSMLPLSAGATNVIMRTFDPGLMLETINDASLGVSHFLAVPAMLNAARHHPLAATTDYSRLIAAIAGGASVPGELVHWWYDRGLCVLDGYGMTESTASNCIMPRESVPKKIGTSGKALMHTEMRFIKADGSEAAPNEAGEIWMRGPAITPGYWNNPEANRTSFVDGWFLSGDIGRIDDEGFITIEDRAKDMYISGGENVYPAEVEAVIAGMDGILEVAVLGVQDEKWGETGCAVVVPMDGTSPTLEAIQAFCEGKLARYKHPRRIHILKALPRNATGKVKKFELREAATDWF